MGQARTRPPRWRPSSPPPRVERCWPTSCSAAVPQASAPACSAAPSLWWLSSWWVLLVIGRRVGLRQHHHPPPDTAPNRGEGPSLLFPRSRVRKAEGSVGGRNRKRRRLHVLRDADRGVP